ncbi:MAG: molybdenum cofactor biosynthesis protein, partial [Deltaproteobacteria bacterium]|nr:molybdenum cofactor biosynthesis protein [Deltaproteobacteria bacterium]
MDDSNFEMKIVSIAISKKKGTPKVQVGKVSLLEDHGLE